MPSSNKWPKLIFFAAFATTTLVFLLYRNTANNLNSPPEKIASKIIEEKSGRQTLMIKNKTIKVKVVATPEGKAKGLAGLDYLKEDEGMLFVWERASHPTYWMKGMKFAIDIIWIRNGVVVGIEKNIQPEPGVPDRNLTTYLPPEPVDLVLEVVAGFSDKYGLEAGDKAVLFAN